MLENTGAGPPPEVSKSARHKFLLFSSLPLSRAEPASIQN